MSQPNRMLLAVDLCPESETLIRRVVDHYAIDLDKLHVVHVIRATAVDTPDPNLPDRQLLDHTGFRLRELLNRNGLTITPAHIHLLQGEPAFEIKSLARRINADLVIVGSHCKQGGWLQLPGATTNCVMQGIGADVMAVKI